MKYRKLGKTGLKVSVISLGTVEIAQDYGLSKKPPLDQAINLLHFAFERGVNLIDTARDYGDAEKIIGEAIQTWSGNLPLIATKLRNFSADMLHSSNLLKSCLKSLETSLQLLGVEKIDILQVHQCEKNTLQNPRYLDCLRQLKESGKVKFLGASIYEENTARIVLESDIFDVIQIALSIFDQRMAQRILKIAERKNIGILARSVLLRGLIPCEMDKIPERLQRIRSYKERLTTICKKIGIETYEAAICFSLIIDQVDSVIVGAENIALLDRNINAIEKLNIVKNKFSVFKKLAIKDEFLISPAQWDR